MSWKRFCAAKKADYGYVWRFAKLVVSVCTLLRTLSSSQPCGRESTICLAEVAGIEKTCYEGWQRW